MLFKVSRIWLAIIQGHFRLWGDAVVAQAVQAADSVARLLHSGGDGAGGCMLWRMRTL